MAHSYDFPRPDLTVDCVVFGYDEKDLKVLLIQRGVKPFRYAWALPGGKVAVYTGILKLTEGDDALLATVSASPDGHRLLRRFVAIAREFAETEAGSA